ncbi:fibronectin type III domain-containing protein [Chryseobacterium caseinilyticum]|uniref:Fibronectin type III domain-containing protein n=1 Tax=Chryseobacterium caseinilyticum TaxID=2771428 RepID=A0ABR8ZEX1_9FLAO|nr:fibronectin type III domain-containing protein [Chryseobacterium caseinilyticum]MBD8083820.1 fibronectin type III domain-containing protein [Chryseobacterium caseinilyticum]
MKKILLLFSLILAFFTNAQVSTYSFVQSTGTYTPLTGATVLATATSSNSLDNAVYPVTLPFPISFNGVNYSALNVSTNGFITFGATVPGTATYSPISSTETYSGAVSAFGRDLNTMFNITNVTGDISWGVVGTAPNREIVIQWKDFRPTYTTSTTAAYAFSFQIRLRETTGTIAAVYTKGAYLVGTTTYSSTAQVGLRGTSNADFNNRNNSTTVLYTASTAGTGNANSQAFNTTAATPGMPSDGLTYTWTPPSCFAPTALNVISSAPTSATIGWATPTVVPGAGYDIYYTTSATPPTAGTTPNQTGVTGTSTVISPLLPATTYYVWIRARCSASDLSGWTSISFVTPCVPVTVLPWTENFDAMTTLGAGVLPPCWKNISGTYAWTTANAASTTFNMPRSTPNYVRIQYGNTNASQLWTPAFNLTAGVTYEYSFYYNTNGTTSSYIGFTGNVLVNTSQSSTGATNLGTFITATQGTSNYVQYKVYFTPTTTAAYNFGVNSSSTGAPWYLGLDDFKLRVAPSCLDPQGFTVVSTTTTSTTVQWTVSNPAPANGYDIYYSTNPATPLATVIPQYVGVAGPTQLINNLLPSTTYYIWIRAKCSPTSIGDWTGPLSIYTNYCVPSGGTSSTTYYLNNINTGTSGFTNIAYTANSYTAYVNNSAQSFSVLPGNSVTVNLATPSGTHYYHAWVDWNQNMVFDANESVYTPTGYLTSVSFPISSVGRPSGSYRVRFASNWLGAVTPCGPAAYGNYVDYTFIIRPCSTTAPTNVTVTNINHISAQVNWTQSPDNLSYKVYWREAGLTTWPNSSPILNPPTTSFVINTGLQPAKNYEVKVVALCNANEGAAPSIPFSTTCDPTPPNVVVSNVASNSALATWGPLVISAVYEIRWREVGTPGWFTPQTTGGTTPQPPLNSYLMQGLESYKSYEVQVRTICVGSTVGNPWSNPQVFTTVRVCSIPPPGLTITQLNPTSAEVTWEPYTGTGATNSYILRYRKVGIPSWTNINVNNANTYTINGLLELTKYEMQVANVCTGTPGNFTPLYYFTTPTVTYCQTGGTPGGPDYINKVTVTPYQGAAFVNPSVNLGYQYYTANADGKQIVLVQGSQGNVVKIDKTSSSGSNTGVAVWIDFNRNGYFDVNEKILSNGPNTADTASASFTVPDDAFVSLTDYKYVMMRVAMQKDGIPVNCTNFANGEVEDYMVRIVKKPVINPLNQTDIMIYPNPVATVLNVKNISKKANFKIYSSSGQLISNGLILNNKIDVSGLINGLYVIELVDGDKTVQKKFIKE